VSDYPAALGLDPMVGNWFPSSEVEKRLIRIKTTFMNTPWSDAGNQIDKPSTVRAITFENSAKCTVIRAEHITGIPTI